MTSTEGADWIDSERGVLVHYLNKMRNAVLTTTESLPEEQLRAPGVPSGTNLLGIVQHLTGAERHWFRFVFLGEDLECNMSMDVPAGVTRTEIVAAYRDSCARSDDIIRACPDLATLSAIENPGEDRRVPLRVIAAHMIEETARHAGHAAILREMIDGTTVD